jgi:hypothetical protein
MDPCKSQKFISQDTKHTFKYGYVTHTNQHGMYKLDLADTRYTRTVNLASYNCVPTSVEFSDLCT